MDLSTPELPTPTTTESPTWYRNIYDLPLYVFILCQINQDIKYLTISGNPSQSDLFESWGHILAEYHEAIGDITTMNRLFLYKEIALLTASLRDAYLLIQILTRRYDERFHKKLNLLLECDLELNINKPDNYTKTLVRYQKRTTAIKNQLLIKQMEHDNIQNNNREDQVKPTRGYYDSMLISLTDFAKVNIDDRINVFTYCERMRRLNAFIKSQSKK